MTVSFGKEEDKFKPDILMFISLVKTSLRTHKPELGQQASFFLSCPKATRVGSIASVQLLSQESLYAASVQLMSQESLKAANKVLMKLKASFAIHPTNRQIQLDDI